MKKSLLLLSCLCIAGSVFANCPGAKECKEKICDKQKIEKKCPEKKFPCKIRKQKFHAPGFHYNQFMPGIRDLYPEEFNKIRELQKNDPEAAAKQMKELHQKFRQQKIAEMKSFREAINDYRKNKDDAAFEKIVKMMEPRITAAKKKAGNQLEEAKKELELLQNLNLRKEKKAAITMMYRKEIKTCEKFISTDTREIIKKAVDSFCVRKRIPYQKGKEKEECKKDQKKD